MERSYQSSYLWIPEKVIVTKKAKMDTLSLVDGRTKAVIESASSEQFASEATYEEYINQLGCFLVIFTNF